MTRGAAAAQGKPMFKAANGAVIYFNKPLGFAWAQGLAVASGALEIASKSLDGAPSGIGDLHQVESWEYGTRF